MLMIILVILLALSIVAFLLLRKTKSDEPQPVVEIPPQTSKAVILSRDGPDSCLNIAQIQVFDTNDMNIAPSATLTSSSLLDNSRFPLSHLVDNNTATFGHTHCPNSPNAWIRLEFPTAVVIKKVVVTNRKDCCGERIIGSIVKLQDSNDNSWWSSPPITEETPEYTFTPSTN